MSRQGTIVDITKKSQYSEKSKRKSKAPKDVDLLKIFFDWYDSFQKVTKLEEAQNKMRRSVDVIPEGTGLEMPDKEE